MLFTPIVFQLLCMWNHRVTFQYPDSQDCILYQVQYLEDGDWDTRLLKGYNQIWESVMHTDLLFLKVWFKAHWSGVTSWGPYNTYRYWIRPRPVESVCVLETFTDDSPALIKPQLYSPACFGQMSSIVSSLFPIELGPMRLHSRVM